MMRKPDTALIATLILTFAAQADAAECPSDAAMAALAADILSRTPAAPPAVIDMTDALCAQDKLVALLGKEWGAPAGYKAGLTSKPAQEAFKASGPVRGVLYKDMMLSNGASLPAKFAALPRFEADLILVVADAAINQAKTPAEVLAHLSAIHPFIELPDLVVADPKTLTPATITAINVGARQGVLGKAIPVRRDEEFLAALAAMQVVVTDASGKELAHAPGAAVLGNPLNSVLWLRDNGVSFKAGDWVSVGSFGPLLVPQPGQSAKVSYLGLPGDPVVSVNFE
ncbi:2-keto-4-pentenoate hydratase [Paracoccus litorisediminis]|uniref:Hydratase n=1 Tax=Paracoccus litorisediminis TaxID=2006130 RepID=A0A844HQT9_9RHOB|nr:hydratase [Paracoccus litorisediminis]MTH60515.1 hydratase [Paracoccus litorisediminis]